MRDPKNMQSEPRKIHMPILRWSSPVVPMFGSWMAYVAARSATVLLLVSVRGRTMVLHREAVHAGERQEPAEDDLVGAHHQTRHHDDDREGQQQRPVGG